MDTLRSSSRASRARRFVSVIVAALAFALTPIGIEGLVAPSTARAVVGRPATPVSYAGTARRSSRRVARRTTRRVASRQAALYTLPADCTQAGGLYRCGDTTYEEEFDGPNVVYVEAD